MSELATNILLNEHNIKLPVSFSDLIRKVSLSSVWQLMWKLTSIPSTEIKCQCTAQPQMGYLYGQYKWKLMSYYNKNRQEVGIGCGSISESQRRWM